MPRTIPAKSASQCGERYPPGYLADHWCAKGHVIRCLSGSLDIELEDGTRFRLEPGKSYHVGDGIGAAHEQHFRHFELGVLGAVAEGLAPGVLRRVQIQDSPLIRIEAEIQQHAQDLTAVVSYCKGK